MNNLNPFENCIKPGCRGKTWSDCQLPNHFSLINSLSNSDFLVAMNQQAGQDSKFTKTFDFHQQTNLRDWFEVWTKYGYAMYFDFAKIWNKLTYMKLDWAQMITWCLCRPKKANSTNLNYFLGDSKDLETQIHHSWTVSEFLYEFWLVFQNKPTKTSFWFTNILRTIFQQFLTTNYNNPYYPKLDPNTPNITDCAKFQRN